MMFARSSKWMNGTDGSRYLVYRFTEVFWEHRDDETLSCKRGHMYYETSTGFRVIRMGQSTFKIPATGVYLTLEEKTIKPAGESLLGLLITQTIKPSPWMAIC
jgi:hypothetical protein